LTGRGTTKFSRRTVFDVGTQRTLCYEPTNWSVPAILGIGLPPRNVSNGGKLVGIVSGTAPHNDLTPPIPRDAVNQGCTYPGLLNMVQ